MPRSVGTCVFSLITLLVLGCDGFRSRFRFMVNQYSKIPGDFQNYMFEDSYVTVTVLCYAPESRMVDSKVNFQWAFSQVECMEDMRKARDRGDIPMFLSHPSSSPTIATAAETWADSSDPAAGKRKVIPYQSSVDGIYSCADHNIIAPRDESDYPYALMFIPDNQNQSLEVLQRKRGDVTLTEGNEDEFPYRVVRAWTSGMYHFSFDLLPANDTEEFEASVLIEFHGSHGFLSAIDFPLLPFNIVMALAYLTISTIWLVVWARSARDSHKIHVAMGVIAVGGSISHTLQFVEYATVNANGQGVTLVMWFARVVSVVQISLFSMLLMVVAVGYGITRPTVSRTLVALIIFLGTIQFITDLLWQILSDQSLQLQYIVPVLAKVVLWMKAAVVVVIAGWVMITALSTVAHLRQGRHARKITVFTAFVVCCLLAFIGQIVMFGLSMGWMRACRQDWQLEWLFSSYDSIVDFLLLIMLMFLWRPVDAAKSYAFAPLSTELVEDDEDDEDELENEKSSEKIPLEPIT